MQSSSPPAIPATPTPAAVVSTLLPSGDYTYQWPGRRGRTDSTTVTIYRKGVAVIVSWTGSTSQSVFQGGQWVNQSEGLTSDTYLGATLAVASYGYTYKLGFQRSLDAVIFTKDGASGLGTGRRVRKMQLMPPSTAWIGLSPSDPGALVALPAELSACPCTSVTGMDLDSSRYVLYTVARQTDTLRPAGVPDSDLPLVVSADKVEIIEWYDPATLLPDYIGGKTGTVYTLKR